MDVVSSVYSLTVGIVNFISKHENKDTTISQIYTTTLTIQQIIRPLLQQKSTDPSLGLAVQGLQVTLKDINHHLAAWDRPTKKVYAMVNPWAMTEELKGDLDQLMRQYLILLGALQTIQFMKSYTFIRPSASNGGPSRMASKNSQGQPGKDSASTLTPPISRADVVWQGFLGKELDFCTADNFVSGISRYIERKISSTERKRLLLKLDEKGLGYVFRSSFSDMVGSEVVTEAISYYSADPQLPLLIWIDDDLQNNARKANDARKYGVTVVQLTSTASAKSWISVNKEFLRKHDRAENVRYITDQVRVETNYEGVELKNWHAGDQIVEFIRREMKLKAPILVYTGRRSISVTAYVESYPNTGSLTSNYSLFQQYVFQLGARKSDTPLLKFNM